MSPMQFYADWTQKPGWVDQLTSRGLSGSSVAIEITEGILLKANGKVVNKLSFSRENNIPVSLDDFGTGYSSLAYLKYFDIDYIKIDRSFVQSIDTNAKDRELCKAIVFMVHALGLTVIAEGIETEAQRDLLISFGCDYGQGYLISKPVSPDAMEALLAGCPPNGVNRLGASISSKT